TAFQNYSYISRIKFCLMYKTNQTNRRSFLKKTAVAGIAAISAPQLILSANAKPKKLSLNTNDVILFQGDSITDSSRDRKNSDFNHPGAMGRGYAFLASAD